MIGYDCGGLSTFLATPKARVKAITCMLELYNPLFLEQNLTDIVTIAKKSNLFVTFFVIIFCYWQQQYPGYVWRVFG